MIATLSGKIAEKNKDTVILECSGVGYELFVSFEDYGALNTDETAKIYKIYIYEHIRENAHDLYGFRTKEAKVLFELLLTVSGVGPKMAMAILSVASLENVRQAIASGDTKFISQASGVGKRVAERVVVDLKDKVGLAASETATDFLSVPAANMQDEAVQALVTLGYSVQDAAAALKDVDDKLPTSERVKLALKS